MANTSMQEFEASDGFSWVDSYLCAYLSELVYESSLGLGAQAGRAETLGALRRHMGRPGWDVPPDQIAFNFTRKPQVDTEFAVVGLEKAVVVVFRGSEKDDFVSFVRDWISTDADIAAVHVRAHGRPHGKRTYVHRGFYRAYRAVHAKVVTAIGSVMGSEKRPVYLTGHSLGGSVASVCAMELCMREKRKDVKGLITFGMPRVGDERWAKQLDRKVAVMHRWVNAQDLVPRVPGPVPFSSQRLVNFRLEPSHYEHWDEIGYHHIRSKDEVWLSSGTPMPPGASLKDHRGSTYLRRIYDTMPQQVRRRVPKFSKPS